MGSPLSLFTKYDNSNLAVRAKFSTRRATHKRRQAIQINASQQQHMMCSNKSIRYSTGGKHRAQCTALSTMISPLIFALLVSAVLAGADATPPRSATTTCGTGILTPPRLHFNPPTSRRRRASPLQVLLSSSRKTSCRLGDNVQSIDEEFINSRAVQLAAAKKTTTRPSTEEIASSNGSGFWPPWPFNHLSGRGRSSDAVTEDAGHDVGGGMDYKKDAKLFWRYISHRARVGARQIQQRELSDSS